MKEIAYSGQFGYVIPKFKNRKKSVVSSGIFL